jgi:hypothetical protein
VQRLDDASELGQGARQGRRISFNCSVRITPAALRCPSFREPQDELGSGQFRVPHQSVRLCRPFR